MKKRTDKQNKTIHAIFSEIANTMGNHGITGSLVIKARPTKDNLKVFFSEKYLDGKGTSQVSTAVLADALDVFLQSFNDFFEERGIDVVRISKKELDKIFNH